MLKSLFNIVAYIVNSIIKSKLKHKCFPANIAKFFRAAFCKNISGGCFCIIRTVSVLTILKIVKFHYLAQETCHIS